MAGQAGDASLGLVGYTLETTAGTYVSPAKWLFPQTNTLAKDYDFFTKKTMGGVRFSTRTGRTTLVKPEGNLMYSLFGTHGAPILKAGIGANTYLTALTADTVKAATPISTANGISTITLTNTATVSYTVGALLQVNTGTSSELRPILTLSANGATSTIATVPALVTNAAAAAGTAVQQIGQLKFTTANTSALLPSLSIEDNNARQYAYKYAGVYVDKINFKGDKDDIAVTTSLFGTVKPVYLASPTSPSPSAAELSDMLRPFTITDTMIAGYGDVTAQGNAQYGGAVADGTHSGLQHLIGVENWEFEWQNNLIKKPTFNLSGAYRAFAGDSNATVKFSYINEAKRDAEWDDYLGQLSVQTVPWAAMAASNSAATGAAVWNGVSIYVPAAAYSKATPIKVAGDVIGQQIELQVLQTTASGDPVTVFVANSDTSAY